MLCCSALLRILTVSLIIHVFVHFCISLGLGAAWKVADISKGSSVVIFGLGTVGLSVSFYRGYAIS